MWRIPRTIWLHYTVLASAIMLPLLTPGFILTLDLVFAPQLAWPNYVDNTYIFRAVLHCINLVLPSDVIEKLLLLLVLVLSGVGAHKLFLRFASGIDRKFVYWGAYFAGMLYAVNPFVYSRFMAGQYLVLLGYALTPFFVMALGRLAEQPGWRRAWPVAIWASVIIGVSLHHSGLLLILAISFAGVGMWRLRRTPRQRKQLFLYGVVAVGVTCILNAYWLVPTLFGHTDISRATSNFGVAEYQAFATNSQGGLGAIGNVVRLQGFWADAQNMYVLPQARIPVWGLLMLVVWVLIGIGVRRMWRIQPALVWALGTVGAVAIILAATPVISWLAHYVPFVSGYREPQKFVALLVLVYALFAGFGVCACIELLHKKRVTAMGASAAACLLMALPLLCAPTMLWGFNGQLQPKDYPADWYVMNTALTQDESVTKVLFLPWHQYMSFGFSQRVIANPAARFFNKPTVVGDNPEFKGISATVPNAQNRSIEHAVLAEGNQTTHLGATLAMFGFSHVLLAKDYDFDRYAYLDAQTDMHLVQETSDLKLYSIDTPQGGADGK